MDFALRKSLHPSTHWQAGSKLSPRKAQYVRKLNQWHMEKNSTNEKWKFAASQIEKRKLEGKETEILINGTLVPSKKLKKEMARYAGDKSATLEESGRFYFLTVMMEAWADVVCSRRNWRSERNRCPHSSRRRYWQRGVLKNTVVSIPRALGGIQ